jgi:tRNA(fMet)-specific endonuclease VapC
MGYLGRFQFSNSYLNRVSAMDCPNQLALCYISILAFGNQEAICAAQIRAALKQSGTPIGAYDLLIGATAITHNLKLITANPQEFARIQGLSWENWR